MSRVPGLRPKRAGGRGEGSVSSAGVLSKGHTRGGAERQETKFVTGGLGDVISYKLVPLLAVIFGVHSRRAQCPFQAPAGRLATPNGCP